MELSEHGIVLIVEESGCLQAKVYLKREVFIYLSLIPICDFFTSVFNIYVNLAICIAVCAVRLQCRRETKIWCQLGASC